MTNRVTLVPREEPYRVHVGDELAVELGESASTGYRWTPVAHPGLELVESSMAVAGGEAPGDPSAHAFLFVVHAPGEHVLRLEKARVWDPANPSATVELRIVAT